MKRYILTGALAVFSVSGVFAQEDDIYASGKDQRNTVSNTTYEEDSYDRNDNRNSSTNSTVYESYDNPYDYVDNDISYSSRINRFNYSFYNMGYYSMFYNPFWYDPFWGYGYTRWSPGWSFGMSFGGPYWSSSWGYNTWFGYGAWGSCWNYPYYGMGWGGYSPYYGGGYWNSYYYGDGGVRGASSYTYGPRQSFSNGFSGGVRGSGTGLRTMQSPITVRGNSGNPRQSNFSQDNQSSVRPQRGGFFQNGENGRPSAGSPAAAEQRPSRGPSRFFNSDAGISPSQSGGFSPRGGGGFSPSPQPSRGASAPAPSPRSSGGGFSPRSGGGSSGGGGSMRPSGGGRR